jgi:hypothetical protein
MFGHCSKPSEDGAVSESSEWGRLLSPPDVRERTVRMVFEHQDENSWQWKAIASIVKKLDIIHETPRSGCVRGSAGRHRLSCGPEAGDDRRVAHNAMG